MFSTLLFAESSIFDASSVRATFSVTETWMCPSAIAFAMSKWKAMQQHPQRGPRRTGSKAVLRKAQHKAQPKGHQRSVQHRPAPGKPQGIG